MTFKKEDMSNMQVSFSVSDISNIHNHHNHHFYRFYRDDINDSESYQILYNLSPYLGNEETCYELIDSCFISIWNVMLNLTEVISDPIEELVDFNKDHYDITSRTIKTSTYYYVKQSNDNFLPTIVSPLVYINITPNQCSCRITINGFRLFIYCFKMCYEKIFSKNMTIMPRSKFEKKVRMYI